MVPSTHDNVVSEWGILYPSTGLCATFPPFTSGWRMGTSSGSAIDSSKSIPMARWIRCRSRLVCMDLKSPEPWETCNVPRRGMKLRHHVWSKLHISLGSTPPEVTWSWIYSRRRIKLGWLNSICFPGLLLQQMIRPAFVAKRCADFLKELCWVCEHWKIWAKPMRTQLFIDITSKSLLKYIYIYTFCTFRKTAYIVYIYTRRK